MSKNHEIVMSAFYRFLSDEERVPTTVELAKAAGVSVKDTEASISWLEESGQIKIAYDIEERRNEKD